MILNVTRIDLAKNRETTNRLIKNVLDIQNELGQVMHSMSAELQELGGFVAQFLQLLMAINRLRQALQLSLEHVSAQLDMLSLGHLSPSIVTPGHLRDILLGIQTELPHQLRLPADPNMELWRYYSSLGCVTLIENDKLLALVPIPLLNRGSIFEFFQAIN